MSDVQNSDEYGPYQSLQYDSFVEEPQSASTGKLLLIVARRWRMVLCLTLVISIVIIPFIWLIAKNYYETEGAIRVTPVVSPILFRDVESDIQMANYENFVNTQASLMGSNNVLNRVADELAAKGLEFFEDVDDYAMTLKLAIKNDVIQIEPLEHTELVRVSMETAKPGEAELIINAFIRAYMAVNASDAVKGGDQKLAILEEKERLIAAQMARQRDEIRRLAEEYGTLTLGERYGMMLEQVGALQTELTTLEIQRMAIQANIKITEGKASQHLDPSEMMTMRTGFVNTDPTMISLMDDLAEQETLVLEMKQVMLADSERLIQQESVVTSLKESIKQREKELIKKFDEEFKETMVNTQQYNLTELISQLNRNKEYEKRVRERLTKANHEAIEMGRKQLGISDMQDELARMKETYDAVNQRIDELQMERKRPAQVSIAYMASSVPAPSNKLKFSFVVLMGAFGFSSLLMLMLERMDTLLRSPEDIASKSGINIIGTTTSPENVDSTMFNRLLEEDYQTIKANIGLVNSDSVMKSIVVTSPGVGDGKTTFAVNLAVSFAKSGKKTLLIDGDLRKPDVISTLSLPDKLRGLEDLLEGAEISRAVYHMESTGLDILASDTTHATDALDVLSRPATVKAIRDICEKYDHIIIDTPPLLAFADAMLWAKISDGVVMSSFVNRTCNLAFKEAIERIRQVGTPVIGAVVNNVQANDPYRYGGFGYGYGGGFSVGWPFREDKDAALLISPEVQDNAETKTTA